MILDSLDDLNWAAVGASLVAAFALGAVWFSPSVLGRFWARQVAAYSGAAEADITAAAARPAVLAKWLAGLAVAAVTLALTADAAGADSVADGVVLGLVLGGGLGATFSSWPPIFAGMPWGWWLVNNGAFLLMLAAMGAILGGWQ
jgi:hypothetical protein